MIINFFKNFSLINNKFYLLQMMMRNQAMVTF